MAPLPAIWQNRFERSVFEVIDKTPPQHAAALGHLSSYLRPLRLCERSFMKPSRPRPFAFLFGNFFFEAETTLYILLSVADLFMTHFLLQQEGEHFQFVESNPVA